MPPGSEAPAPICPPPERLAGMLAPPHRGTRQEGGARLRASRPHAAFQQSSTEHLAPSRWGHGGIGPAGYRPSAAPNGEIHPTPTRTSTVPPPVECGRAAEHPHRLGRRNENTPYTSTLKAPEAHRTPAQAVEVSRVAHISLLGIAGRTLQHPPTESLPPVWHHRPNQPQRQSTRHLPSTDPSSEPSGDPQALTTTTR